MRSTGILQKIQVGGDSSQEMYLNDNFFQGVLFEHISIILAIIIIGHLLSLIILLFEILLKSYLK